MFDLMPFEKRQRNLTDYFDAMEKEMFGNFGSNLPQFRTDILDKGDHYLLQAELPGFSKEEIHVDLKGDRLTIQAEHNSETKEEKENFIHRERRYGSFVRSFDTTGIDAQNISASYNNGVLELKLPKEQPQEPETKSISIL